MLDSLTLLHLVTSPILCLPLVSLSRPPRAPQSELEGIRPIKIQIITPRRGVILTALCGLAFLSTLDAATLVVDLLSSPYRKVVWEDVDVISWVVYSFGGFLVWSLTAILAEWRMKWGDRALSVLGALAFIAEVANLPLLILKEIHYSRSISAKPPGSRSKLTFQMDRTGSLRYYRFPLPVCDYFSCSSSSLQYLHLGSLLKTLPNPPAYLMAMPNHLQAVAELERLTALLTKMAPAERPPNNPVQMPMPVALKHQLPVDPQNQPPS